MTEWALKETAKFGVKQIIKVAAPEMAWPYTAAWFADSAIEAIISSSDQQACAEASAKLGNCPHLHVMPLSWSPPTIRCVEAAMKYRGCAFLYKGTAIYHEQNNLDTRAIPVQVWRYSAQTNKVGDYHMALCVCQSCHRGN